MSFAGSLKGRCGYITYEEDFRQLRIYWEWGVRGPIIGAIPCRWTSPPELMLTQEHQLEILAGLRLWLQEQKIPSTLDELWPADLCDEPLSKCIWVSCDNPRARGFYICKHHWTLSFLSSHLQWPPNQRLERP